MKYTNLKKTKAIFFLNTLHWSLNNKHDVLCKHHFIHKTKNENNGNKKEMKTENKRN